jgi:hypothetical protein
MSELQVQEPVEVLVPLDLASAERLDKRLRLMAQTTRENLEKVARLLDEAKTGRVHEVLGFKSWTAYVADALGGQLELSADSRHAMVQLMAGEGMSERAIAQATGTSKTTVHRDLSQVVHNGPPESTNLREALKDSFGDRARPTPVAVTTQQNDERGYQPTVFPTTGLDGKTYKPKPKPKDTAEKPSPKRRRRPSRKALEHMAITMSNLALSAQHDINPDDIEVDDQVHKELAIIVDSLGDIRDCIESVKPARVPQLPTVFRAKVGTLAAITEDLEAMTADTRWAKAVNRLSADDRISLDRIINHLTKLHATLVGTAE